MSREGLIRGLVIAPGAGAAEPVRDAGAGEVDDGGLHGARILRGGDDLEKVATARADEHIETEHGR